MLDVSTAPEGKQWKSSWKCFQFWQPNAKPSLKSKMVGAAVWARLSVSQDQQRDCVTGAVAGFFKRLFSEFYGLFQDGWSLLRVIWSESDTARVRSSPPPCTTMERSWGRTFASNWPPPSWLGPPSQAWPVAPSNPTQHLHIPEWWIGAPSPFLHWQTHTHTHTALSLWPEKQGERLFLLSELSQPSNRSQLGPRTMTRAQNCEGNILQSDVRTFSGGGGKREPEPPLEVVKKCWKASPFTLQITPQTTKSATWCDMTPKLKIMLPFSTIS